MKFKELATFFFKIENTASRLEMTKTLSELFKKISHDDINKVLYLLQGRLTPQYVKFDFGLGEKMVVRAAIRALNIDRKLFIKEYKKSGDIGKTVEQFKKEIISIGERDLSILQVFELLEKLAKASGDGSQDMKLAILAELIQTLDGLSTRYIVRIPTNTLRLGFSDMTILDALSWMITGDKSLRKTIENAYHVRPDLGFIGSVIKTKGIKGLEKVKPEVFTPIIMMKAQRVPTTKDIIEKVGTGIIEPKYDGFRLQVHYKKSKQGQVKLFSRGLDDVTFMYPDIVKGVQKEIIANEMIFEGEAIGFDPYTGNFLPFQDTVQRKRKYNISEKAEEIPLKMFVFEMLYLNGKPYLTVPLKERMRALKKNIHVSNDIFKDTILISPEKITQDVKIIDIEFDDAVSKGLEGIMVKKIDGIYQPGARGWNWIKYKRSNSRKINDTIDCVVMGYDKGKGKRAEFGIGAFLAGIYDEKEDVFKTVAKIGTGLSDDEWRLLKKRGDVVGSEKKPALYDVDKQMHVDTWIKPYIIVEIQADEITRSTMHTAGKVMEATKAGKAQQVKTLGYALRFPRLKRFRDDKKPEDATTLKEVVRMFKKQ